MTAGVKLLKVKPFDRSAHKELGAAFGRVLHDAVTAPGAIDCHQKDVDDLPASIGELSDASKSPDDHHRMIDSPIDPSLCKRIHKSETDGPGVTRSNAVGSRSNMLASGTLKALHISNSELR